MRDLGLSSNDISDVSPLADLTNLRRMNVWGNDIGDISPLSELINLEYLKLDRNKIEDISPLSGLVSLNNLILSFNDITDISALSGLNNLRELWLDGNDISDISPLASLTSLVSLNLSLNDITEIAALSGLTELTTLYLRGNLLDDSSTGRHIAALESNGVTVHYHAHVKGDYDIELVFTDDFSERQRKVLSYVARRWMAVIAEDVPDYEFAQGWSGTCGDVSYEIPAGERIDDLRIYMSTNQVAGITGYGGPHVLRQEIHLPVLGCMSFNLDNANLLITGLHEIGHVLGFGTIWDELDLVHELDGDTHFSGSLAIAAFDEAGGANYSDAKVPVQKMDGSHWRFPELRDELMGPHGGAFLSAITVQSLADLGYGVNIAQADDYFLPNVSTAAVRSRDLSTAEPVSALEPSHHDPHQFFGDLEPRSVHVVDKFGNVVRVIER
ncbi:MAG: hypothetical protein F4X09_06125 [Gammaproteobacteria bacterium]|nr:hypothetical protein [Gammaproteobacteria bacterium]